MLYLFVYTFNDTNKHRDTNMDLLIENARLVTMQSGECGYLPTPPA
ncbi:imidazolonepropionase, partial [Vibrio parahaemolyticus]|nr:imidazolonepropionase [Vibrio parahaemolyticus]